MKERCVIYWSRRDFRLADNRALHHAIEQSTNESIPLLPLFIFENYMTQGKAQQQFGLPSRLFLMRAVPHFAENFPHFLTAYGKAARTLMSIATEYDCTIHVNEDVHPDFYGQVKKLRDKGIKIFVYADMLTVSKEVRTGSGGVYSIFTPFKNAVWDSFVNTKPIAPSHPKHATYFPTTIQKKLGARYGTVPDISTHQAIHVGPHTITLTQPAPKLDDWYTTETEALNYFKSYLTHGYLDVYKSARDSLALDIREAKHGRIVLRGASSRMSLALAWGLVSARTLVQLIEKHYGRALSPMPHATSLESALHFISELIWREFYKYLLYHRPELLDTEFQKKFQGMRWVSDATAFARFTAWMRGETGYPLVDAAMIQLAHTGYMHNRARMVVASVLTKNLGVDWRWGQEYFRATLIDLDESSNNGGWQWGASVGADPKPIRIFNPTLQAETHDPDMLYQKKWLDEKYWAKNIQPIVPHKDARGDALTRYGLSKATPRDY